MQKNYPSSFPGECVEVMAQTIVEKQHYFQCYRWTCVDGGKIILKIDQLIKYPYEGKKGLGYLHSKSVFDMYIYDNIMGIAKFL